MAEKGRIFTGARARFSIDGVKVGYARNVNVSEEITMEPIEVMDNVEVEEYVPTGYRVTFTASKFRVIGETLKTRGWFPENGANTEEHLQNILAAGEMSATIEDVKTGKLFATLEQVKIQSHNWVIDARGVVGEDVTFNAIRLKDESEV
ncbi:MAG: hypothetical protein JSU89_15660 [Myxococcales bacterium]|nr:MAG: hypothetical protein JSU89_15660 [Myxococcales bacterium]